MAYPEGEMQYIWDGRGTRGPSADCVITADEIRLQPKKVIGLVFGLPELELPRKEIRGVEALFLSNYRFRLRSELLDGACFRPIGSKQAFLAALNQLNIPVIQLSRTDKLALELRTFWNQMRWGGRLRRRHWNRLRHERE